MMPKLNDIERELSIVSPKLSSELSIVSPKLCR